MADPKQDLEEWITLELQLTEGAQSAPPVAAASSAVPAASAKKTP
jgi:hypothetical protein